jgi:hypothetical protein
VGLCWLVGLQSDRAGDCVALLSVFRDAVVGLGLHGNAVRVSVSD